MAWKRVKGVGTLFSIQADESATPEQKRRWSVNEMARAVEAKRRGEQAAKLARELGVTTQMFAAICRRYEEHGLDGLYSQELNHGA